MEINDEYGVHSEFSIEKHKQTYINYLEVVIDDTGNVMYAFPSHQEKLIALACKKLNVAREKLEEICPQEYCFNYMTRLSKVSGACAVSGDYVIGYTLNQNQINTLIMLKEHGLYLGEIPKYA